MKKLKFDEETILSLFGNEAAEDEDIVRLKQYYLKNNVFEKVNSAVPIRILVGHKGIGKSALFKIAMSEDSDAGRLPIMIKPDDIANLGKSSSDVLQTIRDWKTGLTEIICEKVLTNLGMDGSGMHEKLKKYGGKLITYLADTFSDHANLNILPMQQGIIHSFLRNKNITIYIDDLDRGWLSTQDDIRRISALLNAVRDLSSDNSGLYFRVSLRSDVYYLVRTSDESTDKIEGSVIWYSWTNHEILLLLIKRIETHFQRSIDIESIRGQRQSQVAFFLESVFEKRFQGLGKWSDVPMYRVLMSMVRKRPRDLVKLCTLAARKACDNNHSTITTTDLRTIFDEYSQGRVQDTINEFRSELPDIERLLLGMKPNRKSLKAGDAYVFNSREIENKIYSVIERGKLAFASGRQATPKELTNFLYKINFITARKKIAEGEIDRKYFEENRYLSTSAVDFGYDWEVHPAFRWALQPDNIEDIFQKLELSAD